MSALNPSGNEFGAVFGNFNEYIRSNVDELKLGETYLKGLVLPIPAILYPGEKPQQITYEFRDAYFPTETLRGGIASTGFSSMLEAYMNFRFVGVFLAYFVVSFLMIYIEKLRLRANSIYYVVFYLLCVSLTQSFHRSSFGFIFSELIFIVILVVLFKITSTVVKNLFMPTDKAMPISIGISQK
jgi:oligosaccharide repeat unit polymerase